MTRTTEDRTTDQDRTTTRAGELDMDPSTYLLLARSEQRERERGARLDARAIRLVRLRRLDRRAQAANARARLARLVLTQQ